MARRRRALLAAAVLVALAGVAWWRWRPLAAAVPAPAALPAAAAAPAPPPATGGPAHVDLFASGGRDRPVADDVQKLGAQAAEDYRRRARFPRHSRPIAADEEDPIARERVVTPIASRGPNGVEPTLTVMPAATSFEAPEPIVLFAYLSVGGRRVRAREIRGTLLTEGLAPLGEFEYVDDGTAGDAAAGDRLATAVLQLPAERLPDLSASFLVKVRAVTRDGEERLAAASFQYSNPHAFPTGRYRDAVLAGSLYLGVEVEVLRAGRFHLEGTLYSADGSRQLVWAQTAAELPEGRHWMELPFYGLALRELGVDGPYLLRYVALSTASGMPNAKNRVVENAHVTAAYRAAAFTDEPYGDPDLLEAAERLEADGGLGGLEAGG